MIDISLAKRELEKELIYEESTPQIVELPDNNYNRRDNCNDTIHTIIYMLTFIFGVMTAVLSLAATITFACKNMTEHAAFMFFTFCLVISMIIVIFYKKRVS